MQNVKAIRRDIPDSEEKRTRVLVVDDVPTNRAVIKSLLSRPSYYVVEAGDGKEALRWIAEEPFLMLTVKDDIEDVVKALEYGANDYVTRPIDYSVLVARINTLISYK